MNISITRGLVLLLLFSLQWGCSTVLDSGIVRKILKNGPTIVRITATAATDVNPDFQNRSSPIKVRFYLLKSPRVFQNTDFFSLKNQGRDLLDDDLHLYDERVLQPGALTQVELNLPPEKTPEDAQLFLGVVAGYWNVDQAIWQLIKEIEISDITDVAIVLDRAAVSLKVVE